MEERREAELLMRERVEGLFCVVLTSPVDPAHDLDRVIEVVIIATIPLVVLTYVF
jgi:hypothetical protein